MRSFRFVLLVLATISIVRCNNAARVMAPADLFTTDVIARNAAEVQQRVGAPLRLVDLNAENGMVRFQVQNPKSPGDVDQYTLRDGQLSGPNPVQLIGGGNLESSLYPLSDVDLKAIPSFVNAAVAKVGFPDAKPTSLRIRIDEPANAITRRLHGENVSPQLTVTMYIDSPRRKGMVTANAHFEITNSKVF